MTSRKIPRRLSTFVRRADALCRLVPGDDPPGDAPPDEALAGNPSELKHLARRLVRAACYLQREAADAYERWPDEPSKRAMWKGWADAARQDAERLADVVNLTEPADVEIQNHGSIFMFNGRTPKGTAWLAKNLPDAHRLGEGFAVEHRFAEDIADGMRGDDLVVKA